MPLISVVVPVYKTERYIEQCIDSIINQTFKDYEIVLVDDGSPDNCPAICDSYASNHANIRVVHKKNGGLVSARKAGALAAVGKYILAVDSDDFIKEDYLQGFADAINRNHADIIAATFCSYNEGAVVAIPQSLPCVFYTKEKLEGDVYDRMLYTEPFYTFSVFPNVWTKCIRRNLVLQNQEDIPNDIRMGEDAALVYACILDADSMEVIQNNGYMYRYNDTSITHSYDANMIHRCIALVKYMLCLAKAKGWKADKQLYAYTAMIQEMVVKNELVASPKGYKNLKAWSKNPHIKEAFRCNCKLKMSVLRRLEFFSVKSGALWILKLITFARSVKRRLQNST